MSARPIYAALVEANRQAQVSVLESLGRPVSKVMRSPAAWLAHVRSRATTASVNLRTARERLTRAAYALAHGDKGAADEHEKAAIALVRVLDAAEYDKEGSAL